MPELRIRSAGAPVAVGRYRRREPENAVLYQVVREQLETFLARSQEQSAARAIPSYIARWRIVPDWASWRGSERRQSG